MCKFNDDIKLKVLEKTKLILPKEFIKTKIYNFPEIKQSYDNDQIDSINCSISYTKNLIIRAVDDFNKQEEKNILDELYEIYKNSGFKLYIISKKEFENFIRIMLPIYIDIVRGNE